MRWKAKANLGIKMEESYRTGGDSVLQRNRYSFDNSLAPVNATVRSLQRST